MGGSESSHPGGRSYVCGGFSSSTPRRVESCQYCDQKLEATKAHTIEDCVTYMNRSVTWIYDEMGVEVNHKKLQSSLTQLTILRESVRKSDGGGEG